MQRGYHLGWSTEQDVPMTTRDRAWHRRATQHQGKLYRRHVYLTVCVVKSIAIFFYLVILDLYLGTISLDKSLVLVSVSVNLVLVTYQMAAEYDVDLLLWLSLYCGCVRGSWCADVNERLGTEQKARYHSKLPKEGFESVRSPCCACLTTP